MLWNADDFFPSKIKQNKSVKRNDCETRCEDKVIEETFRVLLPFDEKVKYVYMAQSLMLNKTKAKENTSLKKEIYQSFELFALSRVRK